MRECSGSGAGSQSCGAPRPEIRGSSSGRDTRRQSFHPRPPHTPDSQVTCGDLGVSKCGLRLARRNGAATRVHPRRTRVQFSAPKLMTCPA
jgi:hypothetical protein